MSQVGAGWVSCPPFDCCCCCPRVRRLTYTCAAPTRPAPCPPTPPHSFVFEGKAPELKRAELNKRSAKREGATADLETAKEVCGAVLRGE